MNPSLQAGDQANTSLLLDAAICLDDCLIRIYPEEFTTEHCDEAAKRFYQAGGTISRIATISDALRKVASVQMEAKPELVSDTANQVASKIYLMLWDNPGYLPDPVADAFRDAAIKAAMTICHDTGDEDSFVKFCARTIAEWMKNDRTKREIR